MTTPKDHTATQGLYGRTGIRAVDGATLATVDCASNRDDSDCQFPNCGCALKRTEPATQGASESSEREAFEAWALSIGWHDRDLIRAHSGDYREWETQKAYQGWQASAALAQRQPAPADPQATANEHRSCPSHCCPVHGCKYGHDDCPVVAGLTAPTYPNNNGCESCERAPQAPSQEALRCLAFFASCIKSGEPWTEDCQRMYDAAIAKGEQSHE